MAKKDALYYPDEEYDEEYVDEEFEEAYDEPEYDDSEYPEFDSDLESDEPDFDFEQLMLRVIQYTAANHGISERELKEEFDINGQIAAALISQLQAGRIIDDRKVDRRYPLIVKSERLEYLLESM